MPKKKPSPVKKKATTKKSLPPPPVKKRKTPGTTPKVPVEATEEVLVIPNVVDPELKPILDILANNSLIEKIIDLASAGASIGSIAASLKISSSFFTKWIHKGMQDSEANMNTPYRELWDLIAPCLAIARTLAERTLSERDPKYYLTHGPGKLLGEDWQEKAGNQVDPDSMKLEMGQDFLIAMKLLRQQGVDLNQIIDSDSLTVNTSAPPKAESLLEKHGMGIISNPSLPGPIASKADQLDQTLNLEYGDG